MLEHTHDNISIGGDTNILFNCYFMYFQIYRVSCNDNIDFREMNVMLHGGARCYFVKKVNLLLNRSSVSNGLCQRQNSIIKLFVTHVTI